MSVRASGGGRAGGGVHSLSCESCLLRGGTVGAGWDGGERGIATSSTCTGRTPERGGGRERNGEVLWDFHLRNHLIFMA